MNKKFIKYNLIIFLLIIIGCSNQKRNFKYNYSNKDIYHKDIVNYINKNTDFSTKRIKCKIFLNEDNTNSYNTLIKAKKDSFIIISVMSSLNIEILKFSFTKDSFKFINRIEKTYYTGSRDSIYNNIGLNYDYNLIESLLFGRICNSCILNDSDVSKKNILFSSNCKNNLKYVNYILNKQNNKIIKSKIFSLIDIINVEYFYNNNEDLKFLSGELFLKDKNMKFNIEIIKEKDKEETYNFEIPLKYKFKKF